MMLPPHGRGCIRGSPRKNCHRQRWSAHRSKRSRHTGSCCTRHRGHCLRPPGARRRPRRSWRRDRHRHRSCRSRPCRPGSAFRKRPSPSHCPCAASRHGPCCCRWPGHPPKRCSHRCPKRHRVGQRCRPQSGHPAGRNRCHRISKWRLHRHWNPRAITARTGQIVLRSTDGEYIPLAATAAPCYHGGQAGCARSSCSCTNWPDCRVNA